MSIGSDDGLGKPPPPLQNGKTRTVFDAIEGNTVQFVKDSFLAIACSQSVYQALSTILRPTRTLKAQKAHFFGERMQGLALHLPVIIDLSLEPAFGGSLQLYRIPSQLYSNVVIRHQ